MRRSLFFGLDKKAVQFMEIRLVLNLLRRWLWLLAIGLGLGLVSAYLITRTQTRIYSATTRAMIVGVPEDISPSAAGRTTTEELVRTFTQLLLTSTVLTETGNRLGYQVSAGQISVSPVGNTRIFQVAVQSTFRDRVADTANTLIQVLTEQNESLQLNRFAATGRGLEAQIGQVKGLLEGVQGDLSGITTDRQTARVQDIQNQVSLLEVEVVNLQRELLNLRAQFTEENRQARAVELEATQIAQATATAAAEPEITPTPVLTGAALLATIDPATVPLTVEQQAILTEKETQLAWRQDALGNYRSLLFQLSTQGLTDNFLAAEDRVQMERLRTELTLYQNLYTTLLSDFETTRIARLNQTPSVVQIEPAKTPGQPISPQPRLNLMLGAAVGLLIAGAIAFAVEYMDDSIKTAEDAQRLLRVPVIGYVSRTPGLQKGNQLWVDEHPRSPFAEAFRALRTNLEFSAVDSELRSLLVTSSRPEEGKSTVVSNLASSLAQTGQRVVVIDADLRRPSLHRIFSLTNTLGLTSLLVQRATIDQVIQSYGDNENLKVITSGMIPPNPSELLRSERMSAVLDELRALFDIVIIDGPPFVVADPSLLATKVDEVLIVVQAGRTPSGAALAMIEVLRRAKARVAGIVLNQIDRRGNSGSYAYYYNYEYEPYGTELPKQRTGWFGWLRPRPSRSRSRASSKSKAA